MILLRKRKVWYLLFIVQGTMKAYFSLDVSLPQGEKTEPIVPTGKPQ